MSHEDLILRGRVVAGGRRGPTLGFPTANISLSVPTPRIEDGVWAATVVFDGRAYLSTVLIGRRPTFYDDDGERLLEAFLLDFSGDLYGQDIVVELRRYLRPQSRFSDASALMLRMRQDVDETRSWAATRQRVVALSRRGPLAAERRRQKRIARAARTENEIVKAVRDLGPDDITYDAVANRVNAPVEFLRWAYPSPEQLARAGEQPSSLRHEFADWRNQEETGRPYADGAT